MIRKQHQKLIATWYTTFAGLPKESRQALVMALMDLRKHAQKLAQHSWEKNKGPMALYWKVIAVYAGHLAATIRKTLKTPN